MRCYLEIEKFSEIFYFEWGEFFRLIYRILGNRIFFREISQLEKRNVVIDSCDFLMSW